MTVIDVIKEQDLKSYGHSGSSVTEIRNKTGLSMKEIKKELNSLYKNGIIQVREGANCKLIFLS